MCKENCKCHKCCSPCNVVSGDNGCLNESLPLKCTHYSGNPIPSVGITQADNGDEVVNKLVTAFTNIPTNTSDKFVKVSSVDSSSSYLSDKLKTKVGSTITLTKKNSGLNEYLELDVPANPAETKFIGTSSDGISYISGGTNGHSPVYKVHLDPATDPALSLSATGLKLNLPVNIETPLTVTDSATIDLTTSGTTNHNLTASVKISSVTGNALVNNTGLYVPTVVNTAFIANNGQGILATAGGTDGHSPVYAIKLDSTTDSALSLSNAGLKFTPVAEQFLIANDSTTIDFTTSGVKNHTLTADVKISSVTGNIITNNNGLYVPTPTAETQFVANDSSTIDFTTSGIKGHTLTGDVKISTVAGNSLVNNNGLYVANSSAARFGIEDNLGIQNRSTDMQTHNFTITNASQFEFNTPTSALGLFPNDTYLYAYGDTNDDVAQVSATNFNGGLKCYLSAQSATYITQLSVTPSNVNILFSPTGEVSTKINIPKGETGMEKYVALSVNGNYADSTGNVTISTGSGSISRFGIEDVTSTVDRTVNMQNHSLGLLNASEFYSLSAIVSNGRSFLDLAPNENTIQSTYYVGGTTDQQSQIRTVCGINGDISSYGAGIFGSALGTGILLQSQNPSLTEYSNIAITKDFIKINSNSVQFNRISEFADNAAAIVGGLVAGQTYHTAGIVKVVLPAV